jgi:hypothetical protein
MTDGAYTERASLRCTNMATQVTEGLHCARFVEMRAVMAAGFSYLEGEKALNIFNTQPSPGETRVDIDFPPHEGRLQRLEHFIVDHSMRKSRLKATRYDSYDMASFVVGRLLNNNPGFTIEEPYHMEPGEAYYVACEGDPHNTIAVIGTNEPDQALTIPAPETGMLAVIGLENLLAVFPGGELRRPIFQ